MLWQSRYSSQLDERLFIAKIPICKFNEHCSEHNSIKFEVPQGSILGPLFCLLYINDLSNVSNILDIIIFADTSIFFSHKDQNYLNGNNQLRNA